MSTECHLYWTASKPEHRWCLFFFFSLPSPFWSQRWRRCVCSYLQSYFSLKSTLKFSEFSILKCSVFLLVSVCCDTSQALAFFSDVIVLRYCWRLCVLAGANVLWYIPSTGVFSGVSVVWYSQDLVFLLVSIKYDTAQGLVFAGINELWHCQKAWCSSW